MMAMAPDYCVLCQEPHRMTDSCLRSVMCKECGVRGHTKKDCPLIMHVSTSEGSQEKRSSSGGQIFKPFRFDPVDKEEFLKRKGKRKRKKSEDIEQRVGNDPPTLLPVSFTREVPEMRDVIKVNSIQPTQRKRILGEADAGQDTSPVVDIVTLSDSPGEVSEEDTNGDSNLQVIDVFSGDGESYSFKLDEEKKEPVVSIILLSSDDELEDVGEKEKNNNAFHKLENYKIVKDESEQVSRNVMKNLKIKSDAVKVDVEGKLEEVTSKAEEHSENNAGEYFEQEPLPLKLKDECSEHVAEDHFDLKSEEIVVSEKPKEKKSSMLEPGNYSVVSLHVEVFRSNKSSTSKLTQIGCTLWGEEQVGFFRAVKPRGLEKYLDTCKLGGDLLKALHMTREDDGTFQFRSQFEIMDNGKKINCVEERRALKDLVEYLRKIPNCVVIGVDEDTIAILDQRLRDEKKEKLKNIVKGFTCWKLVLKYLKIDGYIQIDLEEFYTDMVKASLPSFVSAKDVSEVLLKAVKHVMTRLAKEGPEQMKVFYTLCKKIEFLSRPRRVEYDRKAAVENLEVYSSLRPCVSATISARQMEQVDISSESEDDCVVTGETDHAAASEDQAQSLQSNPGLTLQEIWRKQTHKDNDDELLRKIEDKFKEIDNRQQQLKDTYGEKLEAAMNVNEDHLVDNDDDPLIDDCLTNISRPAVNIHLSRPLPLYIETSSTWCAVQRKYNPTDSNFWQRGTSYKEPNSPPKTVFCPRCYVEVKYRNISKHLLKVHQETEVSLRCHACYTVVLAQDLEVHVKRKCFEAKVPHVESVVSSSVALGPQTAPKPSDGYLNTVVLPGMWVMSDPSPGAVVTEPWTEEQLARALSAEQELKTYLEDYLRLNYGPRPGAKTQCEWMYMDYQQHTLAGGGNHVLSPKKFLVVVSELMLHVIGVRVGPFICNTGPYQAVTSLSQLYFQGLLYKVKL